MRAQSLPVLRFRMNQWPSCLALVCKCFGLLEWKNESMGTGVNDCFMVVNSWSSLFDQVNAHCAEEGT